MPGYGSKRSYKKGSKRGSKKNYKKKMPTTKALAKRVKHIENDLIELKWFDYPFGPSAVTSSGLLLSGHLLVTQGSGYNNRVGNKISPTSLQCRLSLISLSNQQIPQKVRIVAFWDRQANGSAPVLLNYNNGLFDNTAITDPVYMPRNYNTIQRYTVVYDKTTVINPKNWATQTGTVVNTVFPIEQMMIKIFKLGRTIKYDTNTGALADLVSNGFYIALFTDVVINQPVVSGGLRMYYKDA